MKGREEPGYADRMDCRSDEEVVVARVYCRFDMVIVFQKWAIDFGMVKEFGCCERGCGVERNW